MERKVILAEDGMWITDGKGFYKEVDLGDWDNEGNYTMVTNEVKEAHEMAEADAEVDTNGY